MDAKMSESELADLRTSNSVIREIIAAKLPIAGLKAEFRGGTVTLRGRATDQATREKAVMLANRTPGVTRVDDRLEIGGAAGGMGLGSSAATYTVKKGDTLSEIAQRELGAASKWKEIFEANRGTLTDPDVIKPGQTLKIPR
jgi:nucleoid-associated protein YgaU